MDRKMIDALKAELARQGEVGRPGPYLYNDEGDVIGVDGEVDLAALAAAAAAASASRTSEEALRRAQDTAARADPPSHECERTRVGHWKDHGELRYQDGTWHVEMDGVWALTELTFCPFCGERLPRDASP